MSLEALRLRYKKKQKCRFLLSLNFLTNKQREICSKILLYRMKQAATVLSLIQNVTNTNTLGLSEMRVRGLKTGFVTIAK
jgi:hypothetical protein